MCAAASIAAKANNMNDAFVIAAVVHLVLFAVMAILVLFRHCAASCAAGAGNAVAQRV